MRESGTLLGEERQGEAFILEQNQHLNSGRKMYLESYGCQMNFSDSEIVASIMAEHGYVTTANVEEADLIFMNTCAIRDNAEQRIWNKLKQYRQYKKHKPDLMVGLLGCMAERLKAKVLEEEKLVDIVVGPDAYRSLPGLVEKVEGGQKAVNVLLSREETYAGVSPVRLGGNGITAFVSIMRGCDNMCSFCVVPFTRGRERSRETKSIIEECQDLVNQGYREVTLLGQNVDSYSWEDTATGEKTNFAQLLEKVALVSPLLRVRFSTSHPKDITDEVLHTIAKYHNICNYIHLPVQSGNTRVLELMNRTYTREWYMERVDAVYRIIPDCALSTDTISGFCTETEEEHQDTLSIMEYSKFDYAYMFIYSERPGTLAARRYKDDIPDDVKSRRLSELIDLSQKMSLESNKRDLGKVFEVLVEGESKRSSEELSGRNSQNKKIIFPRLNSKPGDYVMVKITEYTSATLKGEIVESMSN